VQRGDHRQPGGIRRWLPLSALALVALAGTLLLGVSLWFGLRQTLGGTGVVEVDGKTRGMDFLTHYTAGRMVLDGDAGRLYDPTFQPARQAAAIGAPLEDTSPFLLPPAAALLFAPFALVAYPMAAIAWAAASALVTVGALAALWRVSVLRGRYPAVLVLPALLGTYPVVMNLVGANNAAIWLAIYAAATRTYLGGSPVLAGAIFGFGALKPQLFLAAPVVLLARRQWRALLAFAAVAGMLAALSLALVGLDGAAAYVAVLTSDDYRANVAVADAWRMLSLPAFLRALVPGIPDAIVALVVAGGLAALALAVRRAAPAGALVAGVLVTVAVDPHCYLYDGLVLAAPIMLGAGLGWRGLPAVCLAAIWVLTWTPPFRAPPDPGGLDAVPWVVLPLLALTAVALRRAGDEDGRPSPRALGPAPCS
jgi:hypothetical protein